MHVLFAYDISDNKNRTKVFKVLRELGINSQRSVFECELVSDEIHHLVERISPLIDPETDSLLVYPLCHRCASKVHILGQGVPLIQTDWEIV